MLLNKFHKSGMKQASQKEHTLYDSVYGLKPWKTKIKSVKKIVITIRGNNNRWVAEG